MKSKIALTLVSLPALTGSMLLLMAAGAAQAGVTTVDPIEPTRCDRPSIQPNSFVCTRVAPAERIVSLPAPVTISVIEPETTNATAQIADPETAIAPAFVNASVVNDARVYENPDAEYPMLAFSVAESDAAVALFGCDCPACMNSLRQLRNLAPVTTDGRDACWTVVQRQFRRDPAEVIEALSAAENNQTDFYFELETVN